MLFNIVKMALALIVVQFLVGCVTGEKWDEIEEGMTKDQVRNVLGKQDQIEKRSNGWDVHYYRNRLISGWSWDKTDYYILFNPNGRVDSYGHGEVDTRTSERMANWGINQQSKPRSVSCSSTRIGNTVNTDCNER